MTSPVRWGILSTADINRKVIPGAQASEKIDLVGIASRDGSRAAEYAKQWQIRHFYGSYEALLADPEIEAVYISLPNTMHCDWSIRALEAGKHVLCEKPLGRQPEEVLAAFAAAERCDRLLSEAFMYRHHPQTKRVAELVATGAIGELRLIRSSFSYPLYDVDNIRLRTDVDGGALMDVGCYCVNASRLLAGEPSAVTAQAWFGPTGTDWVTSATMRFDNGVLALFDCGTAMVPRHEWEVVGTDASLFLSDPWHARRPVLELRTQQTVEQMQFPVQDSYQLELENMSDAIRGRHPLLLGREDAVAQSRVLQALHQSATQAQLVLL